MIDASGIHKTFILGDSKVHALDNINLRIEQGAYRLIPLMAQISTAFGIAVIPVSIGLALFITLLEILAAPVEGLELMEAARRASTVGTRVATGETLANGPGKLCQALDIDLTLDGIDLLSSHGDRALCLLEGDDVREIAVTPRIGISKSTDAMLRFTDGRSRWVSRRRAAGARD